MRKMCRILCKTSLLSEKKSRSLSLRMRMYRSFKWSSITYQLINSLLSEARETHEDTAESSEVCSFLSCLDRATVNELFSFSLKTCILNLPSISDVNDIGIPVDSYPMLFNRSTYSLRQLSGGGSHSTASRSSSRPSFLPPHPSDMALL